MKKNALYTALLSLSFSLHSYGMGLGDLTVKSYLDQPFNAEIELIDVGNLPISGIKANLASVEDFERVGLEQIYALSSFRFNIERKIDGKTVIVVSSVDRISEPFIPLLVDLVWADGQVYRSYTILLDPPNYPLTLDKQKSLSAPKRQLGSIDPSRQTGVIDKPVYSQVERDTMPVAMDERDVITYGPTTANETVWQIAQRYKAEQVLLQEMILAIVGTNPLAFTDGNLNGLKEGSRLKIPNNTTASKVPASLAELEVLAHDRAWQARRTTIEHALLPPYINTSAPLQGAEPEGASSSTLASSIASIPLGSQASPEEEGNYSRILSLRSSMLSLRGAGESYPLNKSDKQDESEDGKFKSEMSVIAAALHSVREANTVLGEQLRSLQNDNKALKKALAKREEELKQLREKVGLMLQKDLQQEVKARESSEQSVWPLILLLLGVGATGGFIYWWFWIRPTKDITVTGSSTPKAGEVTPVEPNLTLSEDRESMSRIPDENKPFTSELSAALSEEKSPLFGEYNASSQADELPSGGESGAIQDVEIPSPVVKDEPLTENIELELKGEESPLLVTPNEQSLSDAEPISIQEFEAPSSFVTNAPLEEGLELKIKDEELLSSLESELQEEPLNDSHVLEFEPEKVAVSTGVPAEKVKPKPKSKKLKNEKKTEEAQSLGFVLDPIEVSPVEEVKPTKSKVALETLLSLAETYIGMDDIEAARQSLEEVLEHGSEAQRLEAQRMLDTLPAK